MDSLNVQRLGELDWSVYREQAEIGPFQDIPLEVILPIFTLLDFPSLLKVARTCRGFRWIVDDKNFLIAFAQLHFFVPDSGFLHAKETGQLVKKFIQDCLVLETDYQRLLMKNKPWSQIHNLKKVLYQCLALNQMDKVDALLNSLVVPFPESYYSAVKENLFKEIIVKVIESINVSAFQFLLESSTFRKLSDTTGLSILKDSLSTTIRKGLSEFVLQIFNIPEFLDVVKEDWLAIPPDSIKSPILELSLLITSSNGEDKLFLELLSVGGVFTSAPLEKQIKALIGPLRKFAALGNTQGVSHIVTYPSFLAATGEELRNLLGSAITEATDEIFLQLLETPAFKDALLVDQCYILGNALEMVSYDPKKNHLVPRLLEHPSFKDAPLEDQFKCLSNAIGHAACGSNVELLSKFLYHSSFLQYDDANAKFFTIHEALILAASHNQMGARDCISLILAHQVFTQLVPDMRKDLLRRALNNAKREYNVNKDYDEEETYSLIALELKRVQLELERRQIAFEEETLGKIRLLFE